MSEIKTIIPRGQWVLVKPVDKESLETEQGLILPATEEQEQKAVGIVESVGEEVKTIEVGRKVIYGAFAGENIKLSEASKEADYKLLLDEDIIAFVE